MEGTELRGWRRSERQRLLAMRTAVPQLERRVWGQEIGNRLRTLLSERSGVTLGVYWPFQAEFDQFPYPQYAGKVRFHQQRMGEAAALFRRALQVTPAAELSRPPFAGLRLYLAAAEVEEGRAADAGDDLRSFQAAVPQIHGPSDFLKWNDNNRFPLTDWPRLRADLAKIGWKDVA